jgi:hypothetical protein
MAGVLLLLALAGCQSARYVVRETDHGIVAIPADSPKHLSEAEELMREHFPDGYRVVREEVVALEDASGDGTRDGNPLAAPAAGTSAARRTSDSRRGERPPTEWRITYFRTQPPSPSSAAVAANDASTQLPPAESLFSTAGMVEPAANRN